MPNTLVIIFGVIGAFASLTSILKYLYDIIQAINAIKASVSLNTAQLHNALELQRTLTQSNKEEFSRQLREIEARVKDTAQLHMALELQRVLMQSNKEEFNRQLREIEADLENFISQYITSTR